MLLKQLDGSGGRFFTIYVLCNGIWVVPVTEVLSYLVRLVWSRAVYPRSFPSGHAKLSKFLYHQIVFILGDFSILTSQFGPLSSSKLYYQQKSWFRLTETNLNLHLWRFFNSNFTVRTLRYQYDIFSTKI